MTGATGRRQGPETTAPLAERDVAALRHRLRQLEDGLREAKETIEAIRSGDVDAIVVQGPVQSQVYTLENDDRPYRRLIEQIGEGALTLTPDGVILYCNGRMAELLRMPQEKVIGGRLLAMVAADDQVEFERLLARGSGRRSLTLQATGGSIIPVHLSLTDIAADGTRILCGVVTDLTEHKRAETALRETHERLLAEISEREHTESLLRQAQKMEAVGQLTGGVAHDFNNLLTVVIGGLDMIERQLPLLPTGAPTTAIHRGVDLAEKGTDRAATLIQRLLAFSRRQQLDPKPLDVNTLVRGLLELLQRTLGESIALEADLAEAVWQARVDHNQLENALLNLAVNARDAMPNGGHLKVTTRNRTLQDGGVTDAPGGDYVMIAVQDNGVGMDQATLDRAFDPFFTTKSVGSGTGLGLSQVYGFTKQSNGHVTLQSRPGEGTTVEIYLPRLAAEQEHRGATVQAAPSVPRSAPGGTVLVVEDNDDVRAYSVEALRELGYDPLAAKDGWAALHALDHQPQIKLLFADIGLPGGMDGWQLAHEAMRRRAGLKVLLTTGYASAVYAHTLDVPILTKPYTFDVLAATVGRVLGEPAP